jgi:hypothetical protein
MQSEKKQKEKVFYSTVEIEKKYFPRSYKEKIEEERYKNPGEFGYDLATEFLESLKRELMKSDSMLIQFPTD